MWVGIFKYVWKSRNIMKIGRKVWTGFRVSLGSNVRVEIPKDHPKGRWRGLFQIDPKAVKWHGQSMRQTTGHHLINKPSMYVKIMIFSIYKKSPKPQSLKSSMAHQYGGIYGPTTRRSWSRQWGLSFSVNCLR